MAFVYWIHLPEHTDMFTQGYVGITSRTVKQRFALHKSATRKGDKLPINNAIRKYADKLIIATVLEGDITYCQLIEHKLRPKTHVGWNICQGGQETRLGMKLTSQQIEGMRARSLACVVPAWRTVQGCQKTWKNAELVRFNLEANLSQAQIARALNISTAAINKIAQKLKGGWLPLEDADWKLHFGVPDVFLVGEISKMPPWNTPRVDKNIWVYADKAFEMGNYRGVRRDFERQFSLNTKASSTLFRKIRGGWNPLEDSQWLLFKSEYKLKEAINA